MTGQDYFVAFFEKKKVISVRIKKKKIENKQGHNEKKNYTSEFNFEIITCHNLHFPRRKDK